MSPNDDRQINRYRIQFLSPDLKFLVRKCTMPAAIGLVSWATYLIAPLLPKSITKLDRPIFVIGCSRSGTTVFVDMMREHDDIAEWSEAGGVLEPRYYDREIDHVKNEEDATAYNRRRLQVLFGLYTKIRNKRRFLNKHPQNSLRIGFLRAMFPDAKFVHLIREGGVTAYSNYKQVKRDWYRQSIPFGSFPKPPKWRRLLHLPLLLQFGHQWLDVVSYIRTSISRLGAVDDYLEIRYEDFCADPHDTLRRLDSFCGLDPVKRHFDRIPANFNARSVDWYKEIPEDYASELKTICRSLNIELGYERSVASD